MGLIQYRDWRFRLRRCYKGPEFVEQVYTDSPDIAQDYHSVSWEVETHELVN